MGRSILGERYIYQFLCYFIYSINIDIEIDFSKVKNFFDIPPLERNFFIYTSVARVSTNTIKCVDLTNYVQKKEPECAKHQTWWTLAYDIATGYREANFVPFYLSII